MFNPEKMRGRNPQEELTQPEIVLPQQEELTQPEIFLGGFDIETKSLSSEKHPDRNEDAVFRNKEKKIFGVLDGMGGHAGGNVASEEAKNYIMKNLQELPEGLSLEQTQIKLEKIILEANEQLLQLAEKNPTLNGMGTTASIVKIWEGARGERKVVIANVGDSRVYVLRADGRLEQATLDDNVVSSAIKDKKQASIIQEKLNNTIDSRTLSPQEQIMFKNRNQISQALGMRDIKPRISTIDIQDGEKLIVTSDGIHDNLTDMEIAQILTASENNQQAAEKLVNASRNRSREKHSRAKKDDMSVIVTDFISVLGSKKAEREATQLRLGDLIKVRRSSGEIESGWIINKFDISTGNVIVQKTENGEVIEKRIPRKELEELNSPEKKIKISEAKDFTELFEAIEASGGLQGSEKFYEVAELKRMVEQIRAGELTLNFITRVGGFRQKITELLKK